jgi:hypothetical protein
VSVNDDRLERLLGPDLLEPLRQLVVELVEQALAGREHDRRWLSTREAGEYLGGTRTVRSGRWPHGASFATRA